MRVFAIADLHLPGGQDKPMHVFGEHWEGHFEKIARNWRERVAQDDLVLIPGDISWAMTLSQAKDDIMAIGALPGVKVLLRGNHDYWWSAIGQVRASLSPGMFALQNDSFVYGGVTVAGTRGWQTPGSRDFEPQDQKIYQREVNRLQFSLVDAAKKSPGGPLIVMMHFPPFNERQEDNEFTELFKEYGVGTVLYGHLHGKYGDAVLHSVRDGMNYQLVSCDALGFRLAEIA